jgi:Fe-S oxidoreductase
MLEKELAYSDKLLEVVYNCQMCGACDMSCKYAMDMEVLEPINEIRIECVESGRTLPIFDKMVSSLREQGSMVPDVNTGRDVWYEGLEVKDLSQQKAQVIYHAGCRTTYDPEMWKVARSSISLMQKAGIDFGIAGAKERCCGGRAYQMGYKVDFLSVESIWRITIGENVVTGCAECYHAFCAV